MVTGSAVRATVVCLLMVFMVGCAACASEWIWAKGQIHCHTTNSDGNKPPQEVADWYRTNGYQFISITDHEKMTDPKPIGKGPDGKFVMVPGEELAMPGAGLPIHVNAFGITRTIKSPPRLDTPGKSVAALVQSIRRAGGIAMVNHPSWYYALSHRDLMAINGTYLLEIANMSFGCNNEGDLAHLSTEQMWDYLLSNGKTVYAAATDDMHKLDAKPNEDMGPGRGWIVARVRELTPKAVLAALSKGEFYASNGVELADYSFDGRVFDVKAAPKTDRKHVIRFVGKWGAILQETDGDSASYRVSGTHEPNSYIRCKVISSDGKIAWTQAYRLK